jgi:hypothetical protein
MFENRALKRIFGTKRVEVTGGWSKRHNGKLHNIYSSTIVITLMKSRTMRWAWPVVRVEKINACRILM